MYTQVFFSSQKNKKEFSQALSFPLASFFIFALIFLGFLGGPPHPWAAETFDTEETINIKVYEAAHKSEGFW